MSISRQCQLQLASITIGVLLAFALAEAGIRVYQSWIKNSERMDPGFILYDEQLGWRLAPDWSGQHVHADYQVSYQTNSEGFRAIKSSSEDSNIIAVIGDSFTFGLGVHNNENFVQLLDERNTGTSFHNYSVPGYSNDQQWLLLQQQADLAAADHVLWVVYLGNDLFDNLLPFPLQAEHAKPWLDIKEGQLIVQNVPVPLIRKPPERFRDDLHRLNSPLVDSSVRRLLGKSRLIGLILDKWFPTTIEVNSLNQHFAREIDVFALVLNEFSRIIGQNKLTLVLMPGRSYVESEASYSATYQEFFRSQITNLAKERSIDLIDLANTLRTLYKSTGESLFHPNDGHLDVSGHRHVAEILQKGITNRDK